MSPVHPAADCYAQNCHHHGPGRLISRDAPAPANGDRVRTACPTHWGPLDYWLWPNAWHCPVRGCAHWVPDEAVPR